MKNIIGKRWSSVNGQQQYPMISTVASEYLDFSTGIVPDSADVLEIFCEEEGVEKLLLNGSEYKLGKGIAVLFSSNYPVLLFEDGTRLQTPMSSSLYMEGKRGGVTYATWFKLLKGEVTLSEIRAEFQITALKEKVEGLTSSLGNCLDNVEGLASVLRSCLEITKKGGPGSLKEVKRLIYSLGSFWTG